MKLYPDDWPFRLTVGVTTAACIFAAMLLEPVVGIHGFWLHMLVILVASLGGTALGGLVYRLLLRSRPPSGGPQDPPPRA